MTLPPAMGLIWGAETMAEYLTLKNMIIVAVGVVVLWGAYTYLVV